MKLKQRIVAIIICVSAVGALKAAQPDSVYMFSYSRTDGSGLRLAWSADGYSWKNISNANTFVSSDFGPWGRNDYSKRMYRPKLVKSDADGLWHCTWLVATSDSVVAHTASEDLILWTPQTYYASAAEIPVRTVGANPVVQRTIVLDGNTLEGYEQKVPYSLVQRLNRYGDHRAYRDALHAETMSGDSLRYASLKPIKATLKLFPDSTKAISPTLIGIFFEDINYGADGGLYGELIQNRDFEYSVADKKSWSADYAWRNVSDSHLTIDSIAPLHPNNRHYAVVRGGVIENKGYDGIPVKKNEKYLLSLYSRTAGGAVPLSVSLVNADGTVLAQTQVKANTKNWKKQTATLVPVADADSATLRVEAVGNNTVNLDMISLFPKATFRGRSNGLRADLAQTLADLKPKFVRFPGGCVAHGNGVDNIYDWKGSIGELYERKPLANLWGYHQTRGLGYHEYFLFCEDIGAEPLPVLAAGVPCQNSSRKSKHSHDMLTTMGQQCGIPLEDMPAYIQDVLDLIEYANGDARKTEWGRRRARAGHPEPFNLKYIGIGNEDMITPVFVERFKMICDSVRRHYPEIKIVGTAGPFYEGSDYTYGWKLADSVGVALVDEHYYVAPGWMVNNQDFYDGYDRSKPHVYLGEYAAHLSGRQSNIETALSEALYLTAVERNGDVVEMTSYAPLLAKDRHTQWRPDLIYFSNTDVRPTVDYYVQQLYGTNAGTTYVATSLRSDKQPREVAKRQGASVVIDALTGDYIVKFANLLPVSTTLSLDMGGAGAEMTDVEVTSLSGAPTETKAVPHTSRQDLTSGIVELPPYSFTVMRFKAK